MLLLNDYNFDHPENNELVYLLYHERYINVLMCTDKYKCCIYNFL